jgi:sortase A
MFLAAVIAGICWHGFSRPPWNSSALLIEDHVPAPEMAQVNIGLPMRLKIPVINLDVHIESVGVTPGGAMDTPKSMANVAWFAPGPRPGQIGSAVIDGHYGLKYGKASVFDALHKLRKDDVFSVEDDEGGVVVFVVRAIQRYLPQADASEVFVSNDGKSHLNLITCEGVWDAELQSYSGRLVVFADKKE